MACSSCGLPGVDGTCSMCYGDPWHNTDGEYLKMLQHDAERQRERREAEEMEARMMEERDAEAD